MTVNLSVVFIHTIPLMRKFLDEVAANAESVRNNDRYEDVVAFTMKKEESIGKFLEKNYLSKGDDRYLPISKYVRGGYSDRNLGTGQEVVYHNQSGEAVARVRFVSYGKGGSLNGWDAVERILGPQCGERQIVIDITNANPAEAYYVAALRPIVGYMVVTDNSSEQFLPRLPYELHLTRSETDIMRLFKNPHMELTSTEITKMLTGMDTADKNIINRITGMWRMGLLDVTDRKVEHGPDYNTRFFRLTNIGRIARLFINE